MTLKEIFYPSKSKEKLALILVLVVTLPLIPVGLCTVWGCPQWVLAPGYVLAILIFPFQFLWNKAFSFHGVPWTIAVSLYYMAANYVIACIFLWLYHLIKKKK